MFRWLRRLTKPAPIKPDPELEPIAQEYRELRYLGTAISLDRNGCTPEQIENYFRRMPEIEKQYGHRLTEYIKARQL
jgi:hypothetical protein